MPVPEGAWRGRPGGRPASAVLQSCRARLQPRRPLVAPRMKPPPPTPRCSARVAEAREVPGPIIGRACLTVASGACALRMAAAVARPRTTVVTRAPDGRSSPPCSTTAPAASASSSASAAAAPISASRSRTRRPRSPIVMTSRTVTNFSLMRYRSCLPRPGGGVRLADAQDLPVDLEHSFAGAVLNPEVVADREHLLQACLGLRVCLTEEGGREGGAKRWVHLVETSEYRGPTMSRKAASGWVCLLGLGPGAQAPLSSSAADAASRRAVRPRPGSPADQERIPSEVPPGVEPTDPSITVRSTGGGTPDPPSIDLASHAGSRPAQRLQMETTGIRAFSRRASGRTTTDRRVGSAGDRRKRRARSRGSGTTRCSRSR